MRLGPLHEEHVPPPLHRRQERREGWVLSENVLRDLVLEEPEPAALLLPDQPVPHVGPGVRAEVPGRFSALPAKAYAMYAPELRANSDEIKLNILDN